MVWSSSAPSVLAASQQDSDTIELGKQFVATRAFADYVVCCDVMCCAALRHAHVRLI
jgi:hypothetical protein